MNRKALLTSGISALFMLWGVIAMLGAQSVSAESAMTPTNQDLPFADQRDAVQQAAKWLVETHQNDDGGYTSFSMGANLAPSDIGGTLDAMLALAAAGVNNDAPALGKENTPVGFLRQNTDELLVYASVDGAQAGKVVLALVAANQSPRDFRGQDFVALLNSHRLFSGQFGVENGFGQSLAILALSAANEPVPEDSVRWLMNLQASTEELDGSWDDGFGTLGNADATAMSAMALASTGMTITLDSVTRATDFLLRTQLASGGWEYGPGFGENVNSTAMALQALSATGIDFYSPAADGTSPLSALLFWQSNTGAFQADFGDGRFDDFFSTVQALPAAAGKAFPLPGYLESAQQAVSCLATLQDPVTKGWEQFATFGASAAGTSRAIQAIVAVGDDPASERWTMSEVNAVQALENLTPDYLSTSAGGGVGIILQGVVAAGADTSSFAGTDLVLAMTEHLSPTGEYDSTAFGPFSHVEAMLGLVAAEAEVDQTAVDWLLNSHVDGDWGGPDSNGIALSLLGKLCLSMPQTLDVLHATQEADGGWGFGVANPNSSSEVVQGLVAVGENPFAPAWSQVVSGTVTNAADAILAQQGENGCWPNLFGPGDDPFATTDAVLLLTQQPSWGATEGQAMEASQPEETESTPAETPEPEPTPTEVPAATATLAPTEEPTEVPEEPEAVEEADEVDNVDNVEESESAQASEEPATIAEPASEDSESDSPSQTPLLAIAGVVLLLVVGGVYLYMKR